MKTTKQPAKIKFGKDYWLGTPAEAIELVKKAKMPKMKTTNTGKEKKIKRSFKLSMNGKPVIDMEIEGSEKLVSSFIEDALANGYGAFYKSREAFTNVLLNGIKLRMYTLWRDERGHFISQKKVREILKQDQS